MNAKINPLRVKKTTEWLKKQGKANDDYTMTMVEKKQLSELDQLFQKFDTDGTGFLDIQKLTNLFDLAGLTVSKAQVKKLFEKHNVDEISLEEFQKLMLSDAVNKSFKDFLYDRRKKFQYNEHEDVSKDAKFIPVDLNLMLSFLFQEFMHKQMKD